MSQYAFHLLLNYQMGTQASSTSAISTPTYPLLLLSTFQTSTPCPRFGLLLAMEIHFTNILGDASVGKHLLLRALETYASFRELILQGSWE